MNSPCQERNVISDQLGNDRFRDRLNDNLLLGNFDRILHGLVGRLKTFSLEVTSTGENRFKSSETEVVMGLRRELFGAEVEEGNDF